jgi:hypothetical protein
MYKTVKFSEIDVELAKQIKKEDPKPQYFTERLKVTKVRKLLPDRGFKFIVEDEEGNNFVAISFKRELFKKEPKSGDVIDLGYYPSVNRWMGEEKVQLNILNISYQVST